MAANSTLNGTMGGVSLEDYSSGQPKIVACSLDGLVSNATQRQLTVGMISARTTACGSSTQTLLETILGAGNSGLYDIVVAPEYSFLPESGPLTEQEVNHYLELFKEASKNGTLIIPGTFVWQKEGRMFNSCFVLYNGEIIHRYDKMKDGGDSTISAMHSLTPYFGTTVGTFDWEGLKIGVEICKDGGVLIEHGITDRDLVFLVSCGNSSSNQTMNAVRIGGYGIVVDGSFARICYAEKRVQEQREDLIYPSNPPNYLTASKQLPAKWGSNSDTLPPLYNMLEKLFPNFPSA